MLCPCHHVPGEGSLVGPGQRVVVVGSQWISAHRRVLSDHFSVKKLHQLWGVFTLRLVTGLPPLSTCPVQ